MRLNRHPQLTNSVGILAQAGDPLLIFSWKASGLVVGGAAVSSDKRYKLGEQQKSLARVVAHKLEPVEYDQTCTVVFQ